MIGSTVSHYKILEKLGEVRLRSKEWSFVGQNGARRSPTYKLLRYL